MKAHTATVLDMLKREEKRRGEETRGDERRGEGMGMDMGMRSET